MTVVPTTYGRVQGERGVFRGIPFAAPPVGENRFRPPRRPAKWDGVRDATAFGDGCPQPSLAPEPDRVAYFNPATTGPDCLNLNVWTPDRGAAGLPVMVWIHGGGYISGGGNAPAHDGATWARDGVVYVSINYRLHAEGFLYFGDDSGNLGLRDQVAALEWVQENIAAFGGDPGNVTIFGQSAGGVSVMHLLAMPAARGLFGRAIAQSGSTRVIATAEWAWRVTRRMAELLGVEPTRDAFSELGPDAVVAASTTMAFEYISPAFWGADSFLISPFRPVLDGDALPSTVEAAVGGGATAAIDLMAGTTRDETTFALQPLGMLEEATDFYLSAALDAFGVTLEDLDVYRKVARPDAQTGELLQAAWTDWAFRAPTIGLLDAHVARVDSGRAYAYEFTWPSPSIPALGATHALELPFVADGLNAYRASMRPRDNQLGDAPPQELATRMHEAWVGFATTGDPGWPAYDTATRTAMTFGEPSATIADWGFPERELWSD